jgi:hypothetical protein
MTETSMNDTQGGTRYTIDDWGFLRRDGKIIGWTPYDFIWAMKGRFARRHTT